MRTFQLVFVCMEMSVLIGLSACAGRTVPPSRTSVLHVPRLEVSVKVDGNLDEPCYQRAPLVETFVVAGSTVRRPARTRAWLFWREEMLTVAFDCDDESIVASPATANERDVDPQDRVELFLWNGREQSAYYCIEVAARGAVHDYSARFYRKFDDSWTPAGWESAVKLRPGGYQVEMTLTKEALREIGFTLEAGERWRAGLFRADFTASRPGKPDWITWVDAHTPEPDFHVAGALGTMVLR